MDIGIDLGTTFSVIAVYGKVNVQGNYPAEQYLEECNVSLIPGHLGEFAIPSAFWQDPTNPDGVVVGTEAKELAKSGQTPILFSKRSIGTTQTLRIGAKQYTACEVAAHILRYLKQCAEQALGTTVRRPVITHPAYFTPNQIAETRAAAVAAGFDMSLNEQMLMEPVAAAYSYVSSDPRDSLKVLAYDLGGGTFDVTVLERKDGLVNMLTFGGNPLLGGFNFDRRLANWIIQRARKQLEGTGRELKFDENSTVDQSCWAQLLQLAERVKCELVNAPTARVPVSIKDTGILRDTSGKPIQIIDRITRADYTALIQDLLDETIERSTEAIQRARLTPKDIDEVVLVGGSTYGQWIHETVAKHFPGVKVLRYNPDLCVAAGAAIYAHAELPQSSSLDESSPFEILLDVRATSAETTIHVPGTVRKRDGAKLDVSDWEQLSVVLEMGATNDEERGGFVQRLTSRLLGNDKGNTDADTVRLGPVRLNENGVFLFRDVELLENMPTEMSISVVDREGTPVCTRKCAVEYAASGPIPVQFQVVPKPIFVRTGSGLTVIAKEAASLPVKAKPIELVRLHGDSTLDLDVFQGSDNVSTIHVEGIPEDAGAGSSVLLHVEITRDNVMQGKVEVRRQNGSVATEWPIQIPFPPLQIPSVPQLEQQFRHLEAKRMNLIETEKDPKRRTILGTKGGTISKTIQNLFHEDFSNAQEIHSWLQELEALVSPQRDEMRPLKSEFDALVKECTEEIARIAKDEPKRAGDLGERLKRIEQDGEDAYNTKNKRHWDGAWTTLQSFQRSLTPAPPDDGSKPKLPPTKRLKDHVYHEVVRDCSAAAAANRKVVESRPDYMSKYAPRFREIEVAISSQEAKIKAVDDSLAPEDAWAELQPILQEEKAKIREMIELAVHDTRKRG